MGSSRFAYRSYIIQNSGTTNEYAYSTASDIITTNAELSGFELPLYFVTKDFLFGLKLCAYSNKTTIIWSSTTTSEVKVTGGLQFVLETEF